MNDEPTGIFMNKADQVASHLLDRIVELNLHPGSSFGTEAELLEQYKVSRPTLRESLRILESQGVLTRRPGPKGGIMVAKPSIDTLAHSLSVFLRLHNVPFVEILRARMAIEPALVRDAARHGTDEQFAEMDETTDRLEKAGKNGEIVYRENRAFHNLIAKAAANPVLEVFWSTIRALASGEGAGLTYSQRNIAEIASFHRQIVEACRRRDPEQAHHLMIEHLGELDVLLRTRHKDQLARPMRIAAKADRKIV